MLWMLYINEKWKEDIIQGGELQSIRRAEVQVRALLIENSSKLEVI